MLNEITMDQLSDPDPHLRGLVESSRFTYIGHVPKEVITVPCQTYIENSEALRAAWVPVGIQERGGGDGPADARVDAAQWLRAYVAVVANWPLLALPSGIAVETAADRCAVVVEDGFPQRLRSTTRRIEDPKALREAVFHDLFERHFRPLIEHTLQLVRLDARVLWGNVIESITVSYDRALRAVYDPLLTDALAADRNMLLTAERLPGIDGPNPMHGMVWYEMVEPEIYPGPVSVRSMCCIAFHVRRPVDYCRNCPNVSAKERATLTRDFIWEWLRKGTTGSPILR
jgi:ferric iron reductase protein FhuF